MRRIASPALLVLAPSLLTAQEVIDVQVGFEANDEFGFSFVARDVGGPAGVELVIGAPGFPGAIQPGYVQVAAADGSLLLPKVEGATGSALFGVDLDVGTDFDGDGRPDILIGDSDANSDGGRFSIHSSADGSELLQVNGTSSVHLGRIVADLGDVDGDGTWDLAVYAPGNAQIDPLITVASGVAALPLFTIGGEEHEAVSIDGIGDITGDGLNEFAVGSPFQDNDTGIVRVWDGSNTVVRSHPGPVADSGFGSSVAGIGDVNLDGVPDYAVGAWDLVVSGLGNVGGVYAFSGATGEELWRADGSLSSSNFGFKVVGGGDVDGDGVPDAATASLANGHALSGVDGARLFDYRADYFSSSVAMDIALVPDRNGDGLDEMALSGQTGIMTAPGVTSSDVSIVETVAPLAIDCDGSSIFDFIELAQDTKPDCNGNLIPDACDLADGTSADINSDGIPDECQVTFFGAPEEISITTGGSYKMTINAGGSAFGKTYFIAGSLSGSLPGITLGGLFAPLNPDVWFHYSVANPNVFPLFATTGTLGLFGFTDAPQLLIPSDLDPIWAGVTFTHAYALIDGATAQLFSNPIELTLTP